MLVSLLTLVDPRSFLDFFLKILNVSKMSI